MANGNGGLAGSIFGGYGSPEFDSIVTSSFSPSAPSVIGSDSQSNNSRWYENIPALFASGADLARSAFGADERLAGTEGVNPFAFDPSFAEAAAGKVNTEYAKLLEQFGGIANDIAYLTGTPLADAVEQYRERYKDFFEPAAQRGYNALNQFEPGDVGRTPIGDYASAATGKVKDIAKDFSGLNKLGLAANPPVYQIDPEIYEKQFKKYEDQARSKTLFDYTDPATQQMMYGAGAPGSRYSRPELAKFYAEDPSVKRLMSYNV